MLTWLADALRSEGLTIHEEPGWKTRTYVRRSDGFRPRFDGDRGVMFHHTAGPASGVAPSLRIIRDGRSDLPGPLANLLVGRNGHVWVVAAGYCNHAGTGGPWRGVTSGNRQLVGVEVENTGTGERWTPTVLDACDRVFAAILKRQRLDASWCVGHYEWTTRKIDPALAGPRAGMPAYRQRLKSYMEGDDLAFLDERQQKFLANFADQGMKNFNAGGGMASWLFRARNFIDNARLALGANNYGGAGTRTGEAAKAVEDGAVCDCATATAPELPDLDKRYAPLKHPHDATTTVT